MDAILKIIDFGGYVTNRILGRYIKESAQNLRYILLNLEREKLIERIKPLHNPSINSIFHVTKKACVICNRYNSCILITRSTSAIARSLIRSHFLFSIAGSGYRHILSSVAEKMCFLMSKGFEGKQLPHRKCNNNRILNVEEYLLCGEPYSRSDGFCIVYPDKCYIVAMTQLKTLLKRYGKMLISNKCPICFLVICQSRSRANEFDLAGQKLTGNEWGINGGIGGNPPLVTVFSIEYRYIN